MFSKKPAGPPQSPRQTAKSAMASAPGFSILGADTAIKGDVSAESDLHIDGKVEGDIACATLIQGETSEIIGAVKVRSARLAGIVRGTIDAGELVILKSAEIHGDMQYDSLTIEPGAKVDGRIATRSDALSIKSSPTKDDSSEPLLTLASANS
jgi:cytoskeletal protein CcmA (bactofilin family)